MTERDVTESRNFHAGFTFAKRLRDPAFRELINKLDSSEDRHVLIAFDDEPVVDVIYRINFHQTGGRALIAIPYEEEPFGFRLLAVQVVEDDGEPPNADRLNVGPGASIGMIYSDLQPCGTYMPGEWNRSVLFEKG